MGSVGMIRSGCNDTFTAREKHKSRGEEDIIEICGSLKVIHAGDKMRRGK